jgi:EAL domain-containing protein (putative c-di-GMP-specific phosphodiesterase class I)
VVRLGRQLGLDVIVTSVTDPAERAVVEGAGCAYAQGDLFAPAMPAEHLEACLAAELIPVPRPAA